MQNRSGGAAAGFKSPVRFKPFDERPPDNRREFAARSNESRLKFFEPYRISRGNRAIFFLWILDSFPEYCLISDINPKLRQIVPSRDTR